jgi:hypothetical protein
MNTDDKEAKGMTATDAKIIADILWRFFRHDNPTCEEAEPAVKFLARLKGFPKDEADVLLFLNCDLYDWYKKKEEELSGQPDEYVIKQVGRHFRDVIKARKKKERDQWRQLPVDAEGNILPEGTKRTRTGKEVSYTARLSYTPLERIMFESQEAEDEQIKKIKEENPQLFGLVRRLRAENTVESRSLLPRVEETFRETLERGRTPEGFESLEMERAKKNEEMKKNLRIEFVTIAKPRKSSRKG